jgi:broad specificity phosphatase PhoE
MSTHLFLVRHAEVEEKYQRVFGGRIDMNLSSRGNRQAEVLGKFLPGLNPDAVYASPMQRVQQTLAPFLANGSPKPTVLPELREVDFGDWTGLIWEGVKEKFGVSPFDWLDLLERGLIPNAEAVVGYRARVERCLQQALREQPGRNVVMACHGGVIRMMLSILISLPLAKTSAFEIDYASVTQVELRDQRAIIQLLNYKPWAGIVS